ncbi:YbgC/FadM family acyl-CoA thioesterase [Sphingomonas flavalba]|uniref:YbgC/FadM family acyl-CoA thioesterase n=1 Tax=Sphingomonas flavalba TaxID=2559804 RepID=UPI0039DFFAD8
MDLASDPLPAAGRFIGAEHRYPLRVYFEDTDLSGIVYHAGYLRFMERARSDMLRCAGIDQRGTFDRGEGVYAVADLSIRYLKPARLDDDLVIVSRLNELRAATCFIHQTVRRGPEILTQGAVRAAFLSLDGRPRRQPPAWIAIFERLMTEGD